VRRAQRVLLDRAGLLEAEACRVPAEAAAQPAQAEQRDRLEALVHRECLVRVERAAQAALADPAAQLGILEGLVHRELVVRQARLEHLAKAEAVARRVHQEQRASAAPRAAVARAARQVVPVVWVNREQADRAVAVVVRGLVALPAARAQRVLGRSRVARGSLARLGFRARRDRAAERAQPV
jgi:hypothetical protein